MQSTQPGFPNRPAFRGLLFVAAVSVLAAACGSSSPDPSTTTTTPATGATTSSLADVTAVDTAFATPDLPDGLRPWWESSYRAAAFNGANYVLASPADVAPHAADPGITLIRLTGPDSWETVDVSIPTSAPDADLFMSGSKLIIAYIDPAGAIVVSSSEDGSTFDKARLAIPDRYVEADVWSHTFLIGNLVGAADLQTDVFAIANTGIIWTRPDEIAQRYAIEQDPDNEESIRYAGTIRMKPIGDGDFLFEFEKDGETVAEVLASDAGIEDGYIEAYGQRSDDTFESQSWLINGSTSTNLNTAPFNDQAGIRVHSLYPVDGGVGAMVTDFNPEADAEGASARDGTSAARGLHTPGTSAIRAGESEWRLRAMITLDGILWLSEVVLGVSNPQFGSLAWGEFGGIPLFVLMFYADDGAGMAVSEDGATWAIPDYTIDIALGGGAEVQVIVAGSRTTHVYSSGDGEYREYNVEYDAATGDAFIEPTHGSVIPQLEENAVAVRTTPTLEEIEAANEALAAEQSLGLFGDILFGQVPPGY